MSIETFYSEHKKLVRNNAIKLSRRNRIDYADLIQEGELALIVLYRTEKLKNIDEAKRKKYISLFVRGAMLKYISNMNGAISINHNKFYDKDFINYTYFDTDTQIDASALPQDVALLLKEKYKLYELVIKNLLPNFTHSELFVWYEIILSDFPVTNRDAAKFLGYKSGSSITYIKNKIIDRIKEHLY